MGTGGVAVTSDAWEWRRQVHEVSQVWSYCAVVACAC